MGEQIPAIAALPPSCRGSKEFQLDTLGDHVCTCPAHCGAEKEYDWTVTQLADLFHTTTKVTSTHVSCSRGQWCGDIELADFLADTTGPMNLVMELRITYERWGGVPLIICLTAASTIRYLT